MACRGGQCDSVNDKMECGGRWNLGGGWEHGGLGAKKVSRREVTGPELCLRERPLVAHGDYRETTRG